MNLPAVSKLGVKGRLYSIFALLMLLCFVLLVSDGTKMMGLVVAVLAAPFGLCMSLYLMWADIDTPPRSQQLGLHPSRGILIDIPTTTSRFILHLLFYGVCIGIAWYASRYALPGSELADIATDRIIGSAAVLLFAALYLAELMAMYVIKRWSTTPPLRVLIAYLLAFGALALAAGIPASIASIDSLTADGIRDDVENLIFVVPCTIALIAFITLVRNIWVSRWTAGLAEQTRRAEQAELGRKLAESQLALLQAQIEPHFLYNTLASVQYLVRKDAAGADFLLTQLIRYLRRAMPKMREPMSTLGQEFELADAYLQIARMRMGGRLTVDVELAQELHELPFPPLVLQTLVENALKHGVEPKLGPVRLKVDAFIAHGHLSVAVTDDGVGLGRASTPGSGTGLANIRERLHGIYPGRAHLSIADQPQGGVLARVVIDNINNIEKQGAH